MSGAAGISSTPLCGRSAQLRRNALPVFRGRNRPRTWESWPPSSQRDVLDINKMLLEILLSAGIVSRETIEYMLIEPLAKYDQRKMPNARVVTDLLIAFLRDPRRAELRERLGSRLRTQ